VEGLGLVQLPHPNAGGGWAWGAVLASDTGWFPDALLGLSYHTARSANAGCGFACTMHGEALYDFDGTLYGAEYLTVAKGTKLARMPRPGPTQGWAFGAILVDPIGWFPASCLGPWNGKPGSLPSKGRSEEPHSLPGNDSVQQAAARVA